MTWEDTENHMVLPLAAPDIEMDELDSDDERARELRRWRERLIMAQEQAE